MDDLAALTDVELVDQLTTWAGRVAAGEARLLALVGELDRREAWAGPGLTSCAHWLSWRLGMGLVAARERVRVARALHALPLVAAALAAGRLSFSQVRAISRVTVAEDQQTWLDAAQHATGAQLERLVRGVRRAQRSLQDEADPEAAAFRFRTRTSYAEDGSISINIRASATDGAVILAALEQSRAQVAAGRVAARSQAGAATTPCSRTDGDQGDPRGEHPGPQEELPHDEPAGRVGSARRVSLTDALLHLAETSLAAVAAQRPDLARRHRRLLTVQVDPLSGWARLPDGELLPPATGSGQPARLRRSTRRDLTRHDRGRSRRRPGQALRELLAALDGERCRMPGCTHRRDLQAHHVRWWSRGGRTDLANLVLLCPRHHALVHEGDFRLVLQGDRRLDVTTRDGTALLHHPTPPWQDPSELDGAGLLSAGTVPTTTSGQRLDLRYAVSVLLRQAA